MLILVGGWMSEHINNRAVCFEIIIMLCTYCKHIPKTSVCEHVLVTLEATRVPVVATGHLCETLQGKYETL